MRGPACRRVATDGGIRAGPQDPGCGIRCSKEPPTGRRGRALRICRIAGRTRRRPCRGDRHGRHERNRKDRAFAERLGYGASAPSCASEPARLDVGIGGRRRHPSRGRALCFDARSLARGHSGRRHSGHVDAAARVHGRPDCVHGDGSLANFARTRSDAPRRRHRSAGFCDGSLHRQDGHADREPNVDCGTAEKGRTGVSPGRSAGRDRPCAVSRPGRGRRSRERARAVRPHGESASRPAPRRSARDRTP